MSAGTPTPLTRDELRALLHEFAQSLVRQPAEPGRRHSLAPEISTYVQGALAEPSVPTIDDTGE